MAEIREIMHPIKEKFVLHWGEMGTRWGVNRSVAQIHAYLFLVNEPITAEKLSEVLSMARSNVSTSLKELMSWDLIKVTHVLGDRRDHFQALSDTWEMIMTIVEGRRRRELDPTLTVLRQCVTDADNDNSLDAGTKARIKDTLHSVESIVNWFDDIKSVPQKTIIKLIKMGSKITKLLSKK